MAQFELKNKVEVGKIELLNFNEIKKEMNNALESYRAFKVTTETYQEAKANRAKLNSFRNKLDEARKQIKKEYLEPYNNFEQQIKELVGYVDEVSKAIDEGVKNIEEMEKNAKRLDIELFYNTLKLLVPLDKIYKKEWENKTYKFETIKNDLLTLKTKIDNELAYIENGVSNNNLLLKARIKARYLETLDLIKSIDEETEKENKVKELIKEETNGVKFETKDIEVILTVNEKQWYQVQDFIKTIGAKIKKKGN